MTTFVIASLLLASSIPSFGAEITAEHVRNFGAVTDTLYRGGMPSDEALQELKGLGVKLVIDLRNEGQDREIEKKKVEQLGIRYAHIPMRVLAAPRPAEIERALALILQDPGEKIYVHCLRGKDRTGTVIACYRIQHDGWPNERALAEAKSYGLSRLERAMQSFILHFTPVTLPSQASPAN